MYRLVFISILLFPLLSLSAGGRKYRSAGSLGKKMSLIPGGRFYMGSEKGRSDEKPERRVYIKSFYMDRSPVTYRDFRKFVKAGGPKGAYWLYRDYNKTHNPVTGVSWFTAACFCNWRSLLEGYEPVYKLSKGRGNWGYPLWEADFEATGYRLPTEAQFERAARGGLERKRFPWGNNFSSAWSNYDEGRGIIRGKWWRLSPVREQKANAYGLFGMSGNVFEWSGDWYGTYSRFSFINPRGPAEGRARVVRGGSWGSPEPGFLRVARRSYSAPGNYNYDIGFRTVRPAGGKPRATGLRVWNPASCRAISVNHKLVKGFGVAFRRRLAAYIRDFFPESVYFHFRVDGQKVITPEQMADIITDSALEFNIHPLFLTGIMKSESGFGTVSFPRWFNNPMAYHWGNWKMANGLPLYRAGPKRNRRYKTLRDGFRIFARGIRRKIYLNAARRNLYRFHHVYVGYEALEWMNTLSTVYRDISGVKFTADFPAKESGRLIYLDWDKLR